MSNKIEAWHFLAPSDQGRSVLGYGDGRTPRLGETLTVDCEPILNMQGLHASRRVNDALDYAPGPIACRVEVGGQVIEGHAQLVGTSRTIIAMCDASTLLHTFACNVAEEALSLIEDPDPRSVEAIEVKRRWIAGEATDEERAAAKADAWEVAWEVARADAGPAARAAARAAAWSAAWSAARAAAKADAWEVARDAAGDARDAAGDAWSATGAAARVDAGAAQNAALTDMLCTDLKI